ncbi:HPr family phosphocarrier protein [Anaerostipes rhamnosivorans]|uniref:HPr domain-containing protein n=1 Tax=Anaerostipes rhamnosivorans TaxID=1229621 RepID=A0A4P8IL06_9FIRM|nr:HPr family phosphocarrier protein [Anaerostipes rhamnosivorans]QCP36724.1 hypothetical protein AR1Y2_3270 [Anaerostipes rhamnosivorans]
MQTLSYKIEAHNGLHARPCVSIIALSRSTGCSILLSCNGNEAAAQNPIDLMALGGPDAETNYRLRLRGRMKNP